MTPGLRVTATDPDQATSRSSRRTTILNILAPAILSVIGTLVVLEIGFRTFFTLIPLEVCASDDIVANYYCKPYFVYDKPVRIGYRYRPGYKMEGWWDPAKPSHSEPANNAAPSERSDRFWFVLRADEMGFPNDEYEWRDQYDVIISGDSFVTRTAPQTWIELFREQTQFHALTLGAPSWGTQNEVEAVKLYGLDKKPKWVILLYFEGNDLLNAAQYEKKRASGLSWKEYDLQGVPLHKRLIIWHLFKYWGSTILEPVPEPAPYRYPVTASTEAGDIPLIFQDIQLLPLSVDYDTLAQSDDFKQIKEALLELDQLCRAQDTRLLVVYVPSKEHIYWSRIWDPLDVDNILEKTVTVTLKEGDRGALKWTYTFLDYETFTENHNAQERLFDAMTQENGIEFLNLTPLFWEQAIARGELYHYADLHWNQLGNEIAADAIADYVMTR